MTKRKSRRKRVRMPRRKFKPSRLYLDAAVEAFIVRDIASFGEGAFVTANELHMRFPMRYSRYYLTRTLNSLTKTPKFGSPVLHRRRTGWASYAYAVTEVERVRRAA